MDLKDFFSILDEVKDSFSKDESVSDQRDVPAWERLDAAAAGALIISPGSVFQAGQEGFKGLVKSIAPQIATMIALIILGVANPLI